MYALIKRVFNYYDAKEYNKIKKYVYFPFDMKNYTIYIMLFIF